MGLIPQTKCSRCDRSYSGLRSRCPYCGARRSKKGKRVSDADNATWKLIIGIILIVVLIAAVVVILVTSLTGDDTENNNANSQNEGYQQNEGINSLGGNQDDNQQNPEGDGDDNQQPDDQQPDDGDGDDDEQTQNPPTPPEKVVQSITLYTAYGSEAVDITIPVGKTEVLTCEVTPSDATSVPQWTSSDESVIAVTPTDTTGRKANLTSVGTGKAIITVVVDGIKKECIVYGSR